MNVDEKERQSVIEARIRLESRPYSQKGAISIQYELQSQGFLIPPVWKINRILSREKLNIRQPQPKLQCNEYPLFDGALDQMDAVGPRYLKGGTRFYSLNIIDTTTHFAHVNITDSKAGGDALKGVVRFWQQRGIPDFLQMDNALSFRGSNRHPHGLSRLLRMALNLQVSPIFIPIKEPWRNGVIERFNHTFNSCFLRPRTYADIADLSASALEFESMHNSQHRYGSQSNRTALEQMGHVMERTCLPEDFTLPKGRIPCEEGRIYLVRFIRSDLKLDVFGEKFNMPSKAKYAYVVAMIDVGKQCLYAMLDNNVIWEFPYWIT